MAACLCEGSALFVRSGLFHRFLRPPANAELVSCGPFPTPSKELGTGNALLWYATRFQKHSVQKTGFYGTGQIFGTGNALLWYATRLHRHAEQPTPQTVDSLLWYAMHFQGPRCMKTPSCCTGRIFSARNGLREEASKHKKRMYSLEMP